MTKEGLLIRITGVAAVYSAVIWGVVLHELAPESNRVGVFAAPRDNEIPFHEPRENGRPNEAVLPRREDIARKLQGEILVRR